jgi:hypothetical protein
MLQNLILRGKSYCWQDALQQSLLPLQIYKTSIIKKCIFTLNIFTNLI